MRIVVTGTGYAAYGEYELSGLRTPKNRKYLSPGASHLMQAGLTAIAAAGWTAETLPGDRTGIFAASGQTGPEPSDFFAAFAVARTADGDPDWAALGGPASRLIDPFFSLRALSNAGLALLAMELGARGPTNNFVQSEAAGQAALDAGIAALKDGLCDVVLVAASEHLLAPAARLGQPARSLRSEGVAMVLEREEDAKGRGAQVAEIAPLSSYCLAARRAPPKRAAPAAIC